MDASIDVEVGTKILKGAILGAKEVSSIVSAHHSWARTKD